MLVYLPHQLPKWGRKIDGRIATESPGGLKRNGWANKNGINGRIRTDYAQGVVIDSLSSTGQLFGSNATAKSKYSRIKEFRARFGLFAK